MPAMMAPEMSNQVLSCLVDPTDLSGLVNRVQISAGSIRFLIDNARMGLGAWACESSCFANNPQMIRLALLVPLGAALIWLARMILRPEH
jgi:hypothetical protein